MRLSSIHKVTMTWKYWSCVESNSMCFFPLEKDHKCSLLLLWLRGDHSSASWRGPDPKMPTWWVLMDCSPVTIQSTSGRGDPDPLQVMTALSPSRTVRLTWLTLISGRSGRSGGDKRNEKTDSSSPKKAVLWADGGSPFVLFIYLFILSFIHCNTGDWTSH